MVFHLSFSDSKSPQVSRTLLRILVILNNAVVWMVYTRSPTSKSSSPFNNPLVTVLKVRITMGIIVTFMFRSFFQFPCKVEVLILLSTFFQFHSVVDQDSKVAIFAHSLFFFVLIIIIIIVILHASSQLFDSPFQAFGDYSKALIRRNITVTHMSHSFFIP